jgi:DNA primase catalytic subunit
MRPATLVEREAFYGKEFDPASVRRWFGARPSPLFAVKLGKLTGIFKKEFEGEQEDTILLTQTTMADLRDSLLYHLPESVYYDRTLYRDLGAEELGAPDNVLGAELAFDIDPENLDCPNCGTLQERLDRGEMYTFCTLCFNRARGTTADLYDFLKEEFQDLRPVYSGRGFHIHVRDRRATLMARGEREELARAIWDRGIEHDEWVAVGDVRLIRLPCSLHGLVSRIVTPLSPRALGTFDPITEAKPMFLG